jgi:hypothetical protein
MAKQVEIFLKLLFGPENSGYICLATLTPPPEKAFKERFFKYPDQLADMAKFAEQHAVSHNVYFCPNMLREAKRTKSSVMYCSNVWSDLEECEPTNLRLPPSVVVESSPGRYQAYWVLEDRGDPVEIESISRRIAYAHSFQGADRSGWDLTQLLRVPGTLNLKYEEQEPVRIIEINRRQYREYEFDVYAKIVREAGIEEDLPEVMPNVSAEDLMDKYLTQLPPHADMLFTTTPQGSWSEPLFQLEMLCLEAGMSPIEVFIICEAAACNKFKREGLERNRLWRDVQRAYIRYKENLKLLAPEMEARQPKLLTETERERIAGYQSFVEDYVSWASDLGDAAVQYHQAGALIILSSLLSGAVRLPTSFGTMKPNLWFMILADTTLTRKTTAMDIAMDLLEEVDSAIVLATDGSIEGLMGSLATRPGQPSVFLRDEFSGLLEAITRKDYYAGMAEMLTKLYDGKMQKRVLKREIVEVRDPVLVVFAGGIKNKVCTLLTTEHISSGFVPRFVFITAESDVDKVRPLGPPSAQDTTGRGKILYRLNQMRATYFSEARMVEKDGQIFMQAPTHWLAELTPEAWQRYNQLENDMMRAGLAAPNPEIMTPTYDRLCKSALKSAVLLAASNGLVERGDKIVVTLDDLLQAINYCEQWRFYTNDIVANVGLTRDERTYAKVLEVIVRRPGILRGQIMQYFHLNSRSVEIVLATLEQRGQIQRQKRGRGEILTPMVQNPQRKVKVSD